MEEVNPILIALMFGLRCLVPLLIMLGISYLLKRLGLIKDAPAAPPSLEANGGNQEESGDLLHGPL